MTTTIPVWLRWLVAAVGVLALVWLGLAWSSGAYLARDAWAVVPGEVTDDGFAEQKRTIELNGRHIAYVDVGEGPPLSLLHGCPFSAYEWREIIPILAERYRVIAPDLWVLATRRSRSIKTTDCRTMSRWCAI